ncbi:hypothetical protein TNCV_2274541 [Trichonephila clavipes]|nr:hypothetical protein TNCV_2274541 [Trichonephila clavipes]
MKASSIFSLAGDSTTIAFSGTFQRITEKNTPPFLRYLLRTIVPCVGGAYRSLRSDSRVSRRKRYVGDPACVKILNLASARLIAVIYLGYCLFKILILASASRSAVVY